MRWQNSPMMHIEEPIFSPEHTPYVALGGEAVVREIVETFYDTMDVDPRYEILRKVHGDQLTDAREKLFMFLSGWLGGPQRYTERYGHPRLRARHMPFSIGSIERDQWMACMGDALDAVGIDARIKAWLLKQLYGTADWMRNRAD